MNGHYLCEINSLRKKILLEKPVCYRHAIYWHMEEQKIFNDSRLFQIISKTIYRISFEINQFVLLWYAT